MKLFSTLYKVQAGVNKLIMQQKIYRLLHLM